MDDIVPVMQSIVKIETDFKQESQEEYWENEETQKSNVENDAKVFESGIPENEEDEEIKPPLAVFIESNDGEDDDYEGEVDSEENLKNPLDASPSVKEEGSKNEEETGREDGEASQVADIAKTKDVTTLGCGEICARESCADNTCETHSIPKQDHTWQKMTGTRPYECYSCKKCFIRKIHLSNHMRIHTAERPYQCDICKKGFTQKCNLSCHMSTHSGQRPYQCGICKKHFSQKGALLSHVRTHTGERPYLCEICNKRFTRQNTLSVHMRTHTGQRAYECDICKKRFNEKASLSIHMRTHASERQNKCDICNEPFRLKSVLFSHMVTHHKLIFQDRFTYGRDRTNVRIVDNTNVEVT